MVLEEGIACILGNGSILTNYLQFNRYKYGPETLHHF